MKTWKNLALVAIVAILGLVFDGLFLAGCKQPTDPPKTVAVTGVTLDKEEITLFTEGDDSTYALTATVEPSNASNKSVSWESDDKDVATVSNTGVVTAVAVGTATITVTTADGSFTKECEVTVKPLPVSIEVTKSPTAIKIGEPLDLAEIEVTATYSDDSEDEAQITLENITGFNPNTAGKQTVTVTYVGLTDTFDVWVLALSKIEVAYSEELEHEYVIVAVGENVDLDDIVVTGTWQNDGDNEHIITGPITITLENLSDFDRTKTDTHTVTVTYGGKTDTFEVLVRGVSQIEVTTPPTKTRYVSGEELDFTDFEVTATFSDGETETIHHGALHITGFNTNTLGEQTVTVTYGGHSDTFTVTICLGVTFNLNGGNWEGSSTNKTEAVELNATVTKPANPIRDGHAFGGWYTDNNTFHNIWNFATAVTGNMNLYAEWLSLSDLGFEQSDAIATVFNVSNEGEWNSATTTITNGGNNKNYIINVIGDFSVAGRNTDTDRTFGTANNIKTAIRGPGRTLSLTGTGGMLIIYYDQTVLLRDITLHGLETNNASLILVRGTLEMRDGAVITGNTSSSTIGGGVYVYDGTFTMKGGEISGNVSQQGGGVYVYAYGTRNATFTMEGGKISGNTTTSTYGSGGGVYVSTKGTFIMKGGEISGNTATGTSIAGVDRGGGGVYVNGETFIMEGGEISGNRAERGGGIFVTGTSATFTMKDGEISGNTTFGSTGSVGGGVYVSGNATFTMHDGEISRNTVSSGSDSYAASAGGVYVSGNATFTMKGGEISSNTSGRGVFVSSATFIMEGGEISGNAGGGVYVLSSATFIMEGGEISGNAGNGVYVQSSGSTFTMYGGVISDNTSLYRGGGGVYVLSGATFTMHDGEISRNTATGSYDGAYYNGSGGGVIVTGTNATFTMHGGEISGNISSQYGGGVLVDGIFIMEDGEISGNISSSYGGGVHVVGTSTFIMHGGEVSGNTASSGGGVGSSNGTFIIHGGEISGNTATSNGGGVFVTGTNAIFRIVNGIVYGSSEADGVKNTARSNGAALYRSSGIAQHGTFNGDEWESKGDLVSTSTNDTIRVVNGELQ